MANIINFQQPPPDIKLTLHVNVLYIYILQNKCHLPTMKPKILNIQLYKYKSDTIIYEDDSIESIEEHQVPLGAGHPPIDNQWEPIHHFKIYLNQGIFKIRSKLGYFLQSSSGTGLFYSEDKIDYIDNKIPIINIKAMPSINKKYDGFIKDMFQNNHLLNISTGSKWMEVWDTNWIIKDNFWEIITGKYYPTSSSTPSYIKKRPDLITVLFLEELYNDPNFQKILLSFEKDSIENTILVPFKVVIDNINSNARINIYIKTIRG